MDIKRRKRKNPRKLTRLQQLFKGLKQEIKQAEDEAPFGEDFKALLKSLKDGDIDESYKIEEEIEWDKFRARSRVVKNARADIEKFKNYLYENYKNELNFSGLRYPTKWMRGDKKIMAVFNRQPIFVKFLNYLFEYNRHLSKEKREEMFELNNLVTDGEKYNGNEFATFKVDGEFWAKAATDLGCAEITIRKLLKKFLDMNIVIRLGSVNTTGAGRKPVLYSDGYYSKPSDYYIKHPFLTKAETKWKLQDLF